MPSQRGGHGSNHRSVQRHDWMHVIKPTALSSAPVRRALLLQLALMALVVRPVLADECDGLPPPSVTVKRFEEPPRLDTTYSYKQLKVLAAEISRPGNRVLGLTRATSRVSFAIKTSSYVDRSGRWECSSPQFTVNYGFSPMMIYVAKEFAVGSCAYEEVYRHELRHVKAYQDHLVSIERELTDALTRRFATGQVWRAPRGQTRMMLEKEMNERWLPFIKHEIERVEPAQRLIDTPEEYARVAEACGGEIERVVR